MTLDIFLPVFRTGLRIRIRIRVKSLIRIRIKSKCRSCRAVDTHDGGMEAQNIALKGHIRGFPSLWWGAAWIRFRIRVEAKSWIRIDDAMWLRIYIQRIRIRLPGAGSGSWSSLLMTKNWKKLPVKMKKYLFVWRVFKLLEIREASSPPKRKSYTSKQEISSLFFLLLWVNFASLDPDLKPCFLLAQSNSQCDISLIIGPWATCTSTSAPTTFSRRTWR